MWPLLFLGGLRRCARGAVGGFRGPVCHHRPLLQELVKLFKEKRERTDWVCSWHHGYHQYASYQRREQKIKHPCFGSVLFKDHSPSLVTPSVSSVSGCKQKSNRWVIERLCGPTLTLKHLPFDSKELSIHELHMAMVLLLHCYMWKERFLFFNSINQKKKKHLPKTDHQMAQ